MQFNFDLNQIEAALNRAGIKTHYAADFSEARRKPVQNTLFCVLPLDDDYELASSINGQDEYQVTDIFAVMIIVPVRVANRQADAEVRKAREQVKHTLAGLTIPPYEPIKLHRGRIVEFNPDTKNLIYQCQFSVSGLVTVNAKVHV
ncbi:hypothetical protein [Pseudoalteromonas rubra]|uniref:Uncharacterized protein n=1 Tax=Pseudoalteromonas rubra TaxID=43658 RepID=A0A0U2Z2F8_9GAMM|nr:hypothetical protein [Pseudoalteromonas rubra]ALU41937.1 hypothetical protein AT705_02725 [Pseudoalteromonas rubra]